MLKYLPYDAKVAPGQRIRDHVQIAKFDAFGCELRRIASHKAGHDVTPYIAHLWREESASHLEIAAAQVDDGGDALLTNERADGRYIGRGDIGPRTATRGVATGLPSPAIILINVREYFSPGFSVRPCHVPAKPLPGIGIKYRSRNEALHCGLNQSHLGAVLKKLPKSLTHPYSRNVVEPGNVLGK